MELKKESLKNFFNYYEWRIFKYYLLFDEPEKAYI